MPYIELAASVFTEQSLREALVNNFATAEDLAGHRHIQYLFGYLRELGAGCLLTEAPYTDADFLDDFTSYYARCFAPFQSTCRRIHFFRGTLALEAKPKIISGTLTLPEVEQLRSDYLGFVVARPLPQAVIGRTVLKPYDNDGGRRKYPCTKRYDVNLLGIALSIHSLAFQEQDSVLAACATVALWSCFQKTASLFGTTTPTPSVITKASQTIHLGRSLPSQGLNILEMCSAIRHIGLEPEVIDLENNPAVPLLSLLYGYLQLETPIVLAVRVPEGFHAIALVGYSIRKDRIHQTEVPSSGAMSLQMAGLRIDKFYGHDDQVGPFCKLTVKPGCADGPFVQFEREGNLIQPFAAIVPLYNKIRLTFLDVQSWLNRLHSVITIAIPPNISYYWDVGLCLSNNYKTWIRENPDASPELKQEVLLAAYPRFIWRCALKIGPFDLLHVIFDATGIRRSFPVHSISRWNEDLVQIVCHILSEPTSEAALKQILTIKFFELLKASVVSEKPMTLQIF